jgi:DNA-binding winged helix-turn-helix (wHTH) protein
MVERSGRIVSKEELTSAVWPDSFVSDNSLSQCFLEIRKALRDDDQRWLRCPKEYYRPLVRWLMLMFDNQD